MIGTLLNFLLLLPAVFIFNPTRKQLYSANVERFVNSIFSRNEKYQLFKQMISDLSYSNNRKKKMMFEYALLFHLIGMEPEEYVMEGGDKYSSIIEKVKFAGSRWRQNIFQFSVNKNPQNIQIRKMLDDKETFNKRFSDLLGREWTTTEKSESEIRNFIHKYQNVIAKPLNGSSGKGIFILSYSEYEKKGIAIFEGKKYILEQILEQKGFLHQVNPSSVNTFRVNTLYQNGSAELLSLFLRTGRSGSVTDNLHSGGILWQIDLSSGKVKFGADANGEFYDTHPDSKIKMIGKEIPRLEEAIQVCIKAQNMTPELPQIGWDVVISDDYIALIEGNSGSALWNYDGTIPVWPILKKYLIDNKVKINAHYWEHEVL